MSGPTPGFPISDTPDRRARHNRYDTKTGPSVEKIVEKVQESGKLRQFDPLSPEFNRLLQLLEKLPADLDVPF
jgi:hypothetical protein